MSLLYSFCPKCGGPLERQFVEQDEHERLVCQVCGFIFYQLSKPCASALVVRGGRVLLVQRAIEPFKGWWDIPGGFLEPGEHPEAGAIRELREETGLEIRPTEILGIFMDAYPYGAGEEHTLNLFYLAKVMGGEPVAASDAAALAWFSKEELPENIAFRCCREALEAWRQRAS